MLEITNDTWLISDTHFGHGNIIKYCDRPYNHEDIILDAWEDLIKPDDVVLHLGDVWFGRGIDPAIWAEMLNHMAGEKYLILGNHDKSPKHFYQDAGFTIIKPFIQDGIAFTHYPMKDQGLVRDKYFPSDGQNWHTNIHGHVHNNVSYGSEGWIIGGKNYVNISVEVTDYKPLRFGNICATLPVE